jgi:hypothetical protein
MNEMQITNAQYMISSMTNEVTGIRATIDGVIVLVPIAESNRHYAEILRQVEAGTLTIQEAE